MTYDASIDEVVSVTPINEVPEEERVMTLAATGKYPYLLILDKGDGEMDENGDEHMTLVLDVSHEYYSDEGRERLRAMLTAIAESL